jgi:F-type H+-transporting ATPase subunit gamma
MATLREIRRRIGSITSTQQITRAMKMVAAAKLRRAQESIFATRPYANKINEMIHHLISSQIQIHGSLLEPLLKENLAQRITLVAITADRGLCGAFNGNILKKVLQQIDFHKDKEFSLVCVGRKGYEFFSKRNYPIEQHFIQFFNRLDFSDALNISGYLVEKFKKGETDIVEIIFNEFKNAVQQNVVVEQYLPLSASTFSGTTKTFDYLYEPDQESLLAALVPQHLNIQMWRNLLESNASEQGARMTAMENATDNAADLIHELTLYYNRARQAAITSEISEIVGGAEALKSV